MNDTTFNKEGHEFQIMLSLTSQQLHLASLTQELLGAIVKDANKCPCNYVQKGYLWELHSNSHIQNCAKLNFPSRLQVGMTDDFL